MIICSSCGNQMDGQLRFCMECGAGNPTLQPATGPLGKSDEAKIPVPPKRKPLMLIAVVAGALLLLLTGGIAARLLFDRERNGDAVKTNPTGTPVLEVTPPTQPANMQSRRQPVAQPSPVPRVDTSAQESEVVATLNGWAAAARNHDLDGQMSYYAPSLDTYFLRHNVSADFVRTTRVKAFSSYHTLDVQLGPITVALDSTGTNATATFDKTYRFEGDKVLSGSVRQMLWLTKTSGRWLITGERDLHVYYSNK